MITDISNSIRLTNKTLSNKYHKELKQYSKKDGKVYLVILSTINNKIITASKHKQTVKDYINYLKQTFKACSLI